MTDLSSLVRQAFLTDAQRVGAEDGGTLAGTNTATGETIALMQNCGASETRRAIRAVKAALEKNEYGRASTITCRRSSPASAISMQTGSMFREGDASSPTLSRVKPIRARSKS